MTEIQKFCNIENMQMIAFEDLIKIQPKGVLTIPKKIRQFIGLEDNNIARIKIEKGKLIIEPVRTLPYPVRSYNDQEIEEFFELDKKESKELRKKGFI